MKKWFLILFACFAAVSVPAATINVPGDYTTIQAGINAAQNGDTVLVADGVYTGNNNKNLDFSGKGIVLISENGSDNCIIDCVNYERGFYFHSGENRNSMVSGFTIRRGSNEYGGGINITNSNPVIEYCIIRDNASANSYGGGVYITGGSPLFANCTIAGNTAKYGGAMYAAGTSMTINSCIVSDNVSSG